MSGNRTFEMPSHCFRAFHPITSYGYGKIHHAHEFDVFLPTHTKYALELATLETSKGLGQSL
jgi:hypothetical protein